ncbi:MAG: alanine racemase, partial [Eubacteriales bacterium]|nr:alanine racemase [Eubacteriales bacterium]
RGAQRGGGAHRPAPALRGAAAPPADAPTLRAQFSRMRALLAQCRERWPQMDELSMGMSGDYRIAAEEGATIIRLGTALFGPRNYQ